MEDQALHNETFGLFYCLLVTRTTYNTNSSALDIQENAALNPFSYENVQQHLARKTRKSWKIQTLHYGVFTRKLGARKGREGIDIGF